MASTSFRFGMTSKDFFEAAEEAGLSVKKTDSGNRFRVQISHPLLKDGKIYETAKHGEACGNMIKFAASCVKQLRQLEQDTKAPAVATAVIESPGIPIPPEPPAPVQEEKKPMTTQQAADLIVLWLDEQIQNGREQFFMTSFNVQTREMLGFPAGQEGTEQIKAALDMLVTRNIISYESLLFDTGRQTMGYRIHPKFLLNAEKRLSITDVNADHAISMPPFPKLDPATVAAVAKSATKKAKKPKPAVPKQAPAAPAPSATPAPASSFSAVLLQEAAEDDDVISQLMDMYIEAGKFDKLASMVVAARDVEACERILRRVAELSKK